jgi:UPF0271 protein
VTDDVALEPFGDAAWRVRLGSTANPGALLDSLRAIAGIVDAVVCEQHAVVTFEPSAPPEPARVRDAVAHASATAEQGRASHLHEVRVRYDGADLDDVARSVGVTTAELVALHASPAYVVAAIGFLPGFAYLRGLDARLVVSRRATPRPRVPALSVAMAGPYTGMYPFASPGGWHLLGTAVAFAPFEPGRGSTLALGDRVRFVPEPP